MAIPVSVITRREYERLFLNKVIKEKREKCGNTGAKFAITVRRTWKSVLEIICRIITSELHKYEEKKVLMLCFDKFNL